MNILYIEDNPNDANLVSRFAMASGHDLTLINDLQQVEVAFDSTFDLVLVDIMFDQERVGYEVAGAFRENGHQGGLVAITALNSQQDIDDCQQAGFDAVLTKPYDITELAGVIDAFAND